ncbi:hypothetical protein [Nitrogeniibacter aestuarii]|uniref:hypothetical protein n=1 Tax=Nitrogeniibacter aestuarii TaxID=2815343 RepID=UPI001E36A3DE|nr:hypothetical protein [Nitrogeniibacter aestuarii]
MPGLRLLSAATLIALLTACTASNPPRADVDPDAAGAETTEPSPAPEASAPDETGATQAGDNGQGQGAAQQIFYTQAEYEGMTRCVEMADISMHSAIRKRGGMALTDAKNIYRTQPDPEMRMAIVEQVYGDRIQNTWDYTVRHFQRCAITTAQVPQERLQMASYCMQRQMIGDLSYSFKASERPVSDAYAYFANFKSPVVKQIIDAVYATDVSKEEVKAQLWTGCMAPITG